MKIAGRTQYIQETNQEAFMKGGDFLGAGEFTAKVANVEFNDRENRYFTIILKTTKVNNTNTTNSSHHSNKIIKKNNISSYLVD